MIFCDILCGLRQYRKYICLGTRTHEDQGAPPMYKDRAPKHGKRSNVRHEKHSKGCPSLGYNMRVSKVTIEDTRDLGAVGVIEYLKDTADILFVSRPLRSRGCRRYIVWAPPCW